MVGDFELGGLGGGVVVDVDVAPATEAVVWRLGGGGRESVVDVCEAKLGVSMGVFWVVL